MNFSQIFFLKRKIFSKFILLIIKFIYDKLYEYRVLNIYFVYISKSTDWNNERGIKKLFL